MADWRQLFWDAIYDRDPSSMDVARDIALEHDAKIWELGEAMARGHDLYTEDTLSAGVFAFNTADDDGPQDLASIQWTIEHESDWARKAARKDRSVPYIGGLGEAGDLEMRVRYAIGSSVWTRDFSFASTDKLRDAQRTAAEVAWSGLTVMKNFVAGHGWNYKLEQDLKDELVETQASDSGWGVIGARGRRGRAFAPPIELVNPGRHRARATPEKVRDEDAAVGMFVKFNSFDPKHLTYEPLFKMPERVRRLGDATWITYRSKKVIPDTGVRPRGWEHYIHDHNSGVSSYACGGELDTDVPLFITDCTALALLGDCTGIGFGKKGEGKTTAPHPELYSTPCGRALILVQSKRKVVGMIWGGGLDVQDRGIVG